MPNLLQLRGSTPLYAQIDRGNYPLRPQMKNAASTKASHFGRIAFAPSCRTEHVPKVPTFAFDHATDHMRQSACRVAISSRQFKALPRWPAAMPAVPSR